MKYERKKALIRAFIGILIFTQLLDIGSLTYGYCIAISICDMTFWEIVLAIFVRVLITLFCDLALIYGCRSYA